MRLGYDLSNYAGSADAAKLVELRDRYQLDKAIVACQSTDWMEACTAAGIEYEAYVYLYGPGWGKGSYVDQVRAVEQTVQTYRPLRLWLDVEDAKGGLPSAQDIGDALTLAQQLFEPAVPVGIYTGAWFWRDQLGNPDFGGRCPLWNANYTQSPPDELSGFDVGYGGWVRAAVVQYAGDVRLAGELLDLDAWSS